MVVHCAAPGLRYPPLVPIWGADAITLQPIRTGFPCFGAALAGFVEATFDDDAEKNRLCPPSPYSDTPTDWCRMQVLGGRASMAFSGSPEIKAWADGVALNPTRVPPDRQDDPALAAAIERFKASVGPGLARMAELAGMPATRSVAGTPRTRTATGRPSASTSRARSPSTTSRSAARPGRERAGDVGQPAATRQRPRSRSPSASATG